jgi:pimeloyl-ACP methyl ester carboxylesterase
MMARSFLLQLALLITLSCSFFSVSTAMASERTVLLSTGAVNLLDQGEGPSLILLHANPGSLHDYDAVIATLSLSYRVIAIDWPGYGVSPPLMPLTSSNESALYAVLVELMDTLALADAVIMGNSVGGQIAARYAIEHPHRVAGLVLVSPGGFTPDTWLTRFFIRWQSSAWSLPPKWFANLYIDKTNSHTKAILKRAATLHASADVVTVTRSVWKSFLDPDHNLSDSAAAITQPSLLVFGNHDPVIQANKDGQVAKQAMAHADWVVMDSGHMPFAEQPDAFLEVLLGFLGRNGIE